MPQEYVARWIGSRIGAGASVFHFASIGSGSSAATVAGAVRACFNSLAALIPNDVTITFDGEVRDLDNAGVLTAVYPITAPASVTGTSTAVYTNGSGLMVRHNTASIIAGRRLLGRTFIVPLASSGFDTNGDVSNVTQTSVNSAFATLLTTAAGPGANLSVWSRKNSAVAPVTSSQTMPRPSTLRTRNDRV